MTFRITFEVSKFVTLDVDDEEQGREILSKEGWTNIEYRGYDLIDPTTDDLGLLSTDHGLFDLLEGQETLNIDDLK
jgi:hypothetical protein